VLWLLCRVLIHLIAICHWSAIESQVVLDWGNMWLVGSIVQGCNGNSGVGRKGECVLRYLQQSGTTWSMLVLHSASSIAAAI